MKKILLITFIIIQSLIALPYTVVSNGTPINIDVDVSEQLYSVKLNTTTNKYELLIYNKDTNTIEGVYDLNGLPAGTVITNPATSQKYIILYDNINFTNILKKM